MVEQGGGTGISVVLCTYQGAAYVAEQVASILAQSRPAAELVVADDGSTDGTPGIVAGLVAAHAAAHPDATPRLVALAAEGRPLGVAGNFARALGAATGDLLALSDQDDVWHPDRLARYARVFEDDPATLLVHGDARLVDAAGADLGVTLFQALGMSPRELDEIARGRELDALLRRNLATGATTVLRREVRDRALPVPAGWIHDEWLAVVAAATGRTAVLAEPLTDYRQHGANQIGARRITVGDRLARLRAPRSERNARLLQRARSLAERLAALDGVRPADLAAARAKVAHEERRSALPAFPPARIPGVLRAAAAGGYARFGGGAQDVLRDLVQPARTPTP